ncbi:MAG TPA: DUF4124 domain-containing protein, partial [Halothiobacillus sp.]|nr:DUF4124 domain-containing protein [Halothiobacillus sp.]
PQPCFAARHPAQYPTRQPTWIAPLLLAVCLSPLAHSASAETVYKYTNSQGDTVFTDQPTKGAQKITIDPPPVIPLTPINLPPSAPAAPITAAPLPNTAPNTVPNAPLVPSMQMPPVTQSGTPALPQGDSMTHLAPPAAPSSHPQMIRSPLPESAAPAVPRVAPNGHYQSLVITEPSAGPLTAREGGTIFVQVKLNPALDVTAGDRMRIVIDGNVQVDDSTGQRFMLSNLTDGSHTLIAIVMRHGQNIFQSNPVVIQVSGGLPPASIAPK